MHPSILDTWKTSERERATRRAHRRHLVRSCALGVTFAFALVGVATVGRMIAEHTRAPDPWYAPRDAQERAILEEYGEGDQGMEKLWELRTGCAYEQDCEVTR